MRPVRFDSNETAALTHADWLGRQQLTEPISEFAADSPLEEAEFELLVPPAGAGLFCGERDGNNSSSRTI
jgi:hypothetical protein